MQGFAATANNSTGTYSGSTYVDVVRIGGTPTRIPGTARPYASTFIGAGLNQEVYDFGRIATQAAADDARVEAERLSAEGLRLVIDYDVEEAYFAVYAAKSVLSASEDAYRRAVVHRDLARAGVASGLRPPIELTRAEAVLGHFELGRLRAAGGVKGSQALFAAAVGVPEPALDIAGTPPAPADLPSVEDSLGRAASHNPEWLAAMARITAQEEKRTRAIRAEARPNVFLTAGLSGAGGGARRRAAVTARPRWASPRWCPTGPRNRLSWPIFDATIAARAGTVRADESAFRGARRHGR